MTAVRAHHGPLLWRAVAVALAALVAGALSAAPAKAHTELTGSDPGDEDTVTEALDVVVLEYNEDVALAQIEVLDPDGESVIDGEPENYGDVVEQPLGELTTQGTYTVEWRVVSADDHPVEGDFTFEYEGSVAGNEPAAEEPAAGEPVEEPAEEPAEEEPVEEAGGEAEDEELVAEPATAETDEGSLPMGLIAALVVVALVAAGFFALRGRGPGEAGPQA